MTSPPAGRGRRRVLILIPNLARDLEGHALLGYWLEEMGFSVDYCNRHRVVEALLAKASSALVLDHLEVETKVSQARLARRLGARVFLLPTAGFFQDPELELARAGSRFVRTGERLFDRYLAWGEHAAGQLRASGVLAPDQIEVVGCPRFDFYAAPFLSGRAAEDNPGGLGSTRRDAPLVVWTTNTYHRQARDLARRLQQRRSDLPESYLRDELADDETQNRELSACVRELARRRPDWSFAIRVHPAEPPEPYREFAREFPNVRVDEGPSLRDLLASSTALLQRTSTTATEAWMLGRPVLDFARGSYRRPARPEYLAGVDVVRSSAEAERRIAAAAAGEPLDPAQVSHRNRFLEANYRAIDGQSARRAAEAIARDLSPEAFPDERQRRLEASADAEQAAWRRAADRRLANRVKDALGLDRSVSLRFWQRRSSSDTEDFSIGAERLEKLYRRYAEILRNRGEAA